MTTGIWRVSVNQVARLGGGQYLPKICGLKCPVAGGNSFSDAPDLVGDFCHVRLREPIGFMAIRHVEFPMAVKSHHTLEALPVHEKEIQGGRLGVETIAD